MCIDNLLSRLEKVKQTTSDQFVACCPAHDDKSPSLSIRALPDGKILLHCFANCSIDNVLGSIGLSLEDLFPENYEQSKPIKRKISSISVLEVIYFEGLVIQNVVRGVLLEKDITKEDYSRLNIAYERVNSAYNYYKD
jgi:hypothetical protein